ncbi:MAG: DUF1934 domain-containing protein [Clostridiales bacterium]|nr:DUF1934 domain-containing protein [Clostridiales bacterium]
MENNAVISILSNNNISEGEQIEVLSPGKYIKLDDGYKAIYEETELSGMDGTTTTVIIKEKEVILEREGTTTTKMIFNENEPSISLYNTPYGMLEITISTNRLDVDMNDEGGEISINYDMAIAGQSPLNTSLLLKVKMTKQ